MNKKMFIICAVFALISSCKNYASDKDEKKLEQNLEKKVEGFLDFAGTKDGVKEKLMQSDEQVAQWSDEKEKLKEIEKEFEELKNKIDGVDGQTALGTYNEYEEKIKKLQEKLKELQNKEKKNELEDGLKKLKESLKKRIEERKKDLEDAKKKFKEFKEQVEGADGKSEGDKSKNQGNIGGVAWQLANKLGFKGVTSVGNSSNTSDMTKKTIENTLQKIDEELKELENKKE
ncbi:ErpL protein [Borreliella kurtenbachii]|uniref:ErpL protein n=1 Tax=Borreliella kurtenbachii TaxID=1196056 RepID=UPI003AB850BE